MKNSIQVLMTLGLLLSGTGFARSGDGDTISMAANREEIRIAHTERVTGQLTEIQGRLQITDQNGRTYRIDDQKGVAREAFLAGNHKVRIEGTTSGSGAIIANSIDTLD